MLHQAKLVELLHVQKLEEAMFRIGSTSCQLLFSTGAPSQRRRALALAWIRSAQLSHLSRAAQNLNRSQALFDHMQHFGGAFFFGAGGGGGGGDSLAKTYDCSSKKSILIPHLPLEFCVAAMAAVVQKGQGAETHWHLMAIRLSCHTSMLHFRFWIEEGEGTVEWGAERENGGKSEKERGREGEREGERGREGARGREGEGEEGEGESGRERELEKPEGYSVSRAPPANCADGCSCQWYGKGGSCKGRAVPVSW